MIFEHVFFDAQKSLQKNSTGSTSGASGESSAPSWACLGAVLSGLGFVLIRVGPCSAQHRPKTKPKQLKTDLREAQDGAEDPPEAPEVDPVLFFARIFERRKKSVQKSLQKTGQDRPGAILYCFLQ